MNQWLKYKNWSLRKKMSVIISTLLFIPLSLIIMINYYNQTTEIKKNVQWSTEILLSQGSNNIDYYFNDANELINAVFLNEFVVEQLNNLESSSSNNYERILAEQSIERILRSFVKTKDYIKNFFIVDRKNNFYGSETYANKEILLNKDWFKEVHEGNVKKNFTYVDNPSDYLGQVTINYPKGPSIMVLLQYYDFNKNKRLGTIGIEIRYDAIQKILDTIGQLKESDTVVVNREWEMVGRDNQQMQAIIDDVRDEKSDSGTKKTNDFLIVYDTIPSNDWKVIQSNDINALLRGPRKSLTTAVAIGVIFLFIGEILILYMSYQMSKPIENLKKQMLQVEAGDYETRVEVKHKDEVGQLSLTFNKMVSELQGQIILIKKKEKEKRDIEFRLLQEQINPHFLYNTLNSMVWLSRIQNTPAMTDGLRSLIYLLKNTIHSGNEFITIEEEVEFIKHYVTILRLRYGNKFNVIYTVEEATKGMRIPKLLIQPIIENSIVHGIRHDDFDNIIQVEVRLENKSMYISISDNGIGIDQVALERLLNEKDQADTKMYHIGLQNIQDRLALYYSDEAKIQIVSEQNKGTQVVIELPKAEVV